MIKNEDFQYKSVKDNPAVLGTLEGPVADITNGTRNGRKYSEELWQKAFENDIVKEQFASGGLLGELNHPVDREETDLEKVAICMPAPPTKKDGKLWAKLHILDTPCGRILKTLCDYGYKIGISSRGTGDVYDDVDGERVDPDTYQLNAFDAVIIPAVKEARLEMVTESLQPKKSLKVALNESLEKASESDRKIMEETLKELKLEEEPLEEAFNPHMKVIEVIDDCLEEISRQANGDPDPDDIGDFLQGIIGQCRELADSYGVLVESVESSEASSDTEKEEEAPTEEVVDDKSEEENAQLVAEFKEALMNSQRLEKDNLSLQEQLSVCNAKEKSLEEELAKYKKAIVSLSDKAKTIKPLQEKLDNALNESLSKDETIKSNACKLQLLTRRKTQLKEQLDKFKSKADDLQTQVNSLTEELNKNKTKLSNTVNTANRYKNELTEAKKELVSAKATAYGISEKALTQKLGESYKLKEIDSVCEDLRNYKSQVNKLPFRLSEDTKMSITPSQNITKKSMPDDDISSLLQLLQ